MSTQHRIPHLGVDAKGKILLKAYVLQFGNVAGWPYHYARALEKIGVASISVKPVETDFTGPDGRKLDRQLPSDRVLWQPDDHVVARTLKALALISNATRRASVIHYYGSPILGGYDAMWFKACGIPQVISWSGSDARIVSIARKRNPHFYREADEARDCDIRKRLAFYGKHIRVCATDPEMAEYSEPYFEKVLTLRPPVDLRECICQVPDPDRQVPVVLHIPTHPIIKGTEHVVRAVERLQSEGYRFEFKLMESNLTQRQVKVELSKADIYVDELRCGACGMTSVEAMASGKPTITFIRDDLIGKYPADLPVVNATPETIYARLKELVSNGELRQDLGQRGRAYAEKYHSLEAVGPDLLRIYRAAGWTQADGAAAS